MEGGAGAHDYSLEESSDDQGGWISWFCDLEGHEFFIEVRSDSFRFFPPFPLITYCLGRRGLHPRYLQSVRFETVNQELQVSPSLMK